MLTAEPKARSRSLALAAIVILVVFPACSSTQDVLEPSAITPPATSSEATTDPDAPASEQPSTPSASTTASTSNGPATAAGVAAVAAVSDAKVQIAPIVGTSVEAATALSKGLSERARSRGIQLTGSSVPPSHVLKGYFTPLVEGAETTVVFVWDIYDPKGNRIHRISGQQKSQSAGGAGWTAVPNASMQAIADTTIDQLATWLAGSTG